MGGWPCGGWACARGLTKRQGGKGGQAGRLGGRAWKRLRQKLIVYGVSECIVAREIGTCLCSSNK